MFCLYTYVLGASIQTLSWPGTTNWTTILSSFLSASILER